MMKYIGFSLCSCPSFPRANLVRTVSAWRRQEAQSPSSQRCSPAARERASRFLLGVARRYSQLRRNVVRLPLESAQVVRAVALLPARLFARHDLRLSLGGAQVGKSVLTQRDWLVSKGRFRRCMGVVQFVKRQRGKQLWYLQNLLVKYC